NMQTHVQTTDASAASAEVTLLPPSAEKTLHWITVLSSAGLDYRLSHQQGTWQLHIPQALAERAASEIRSFEQDESIRLVAPQAKPNPSAPILRDAHWVALWCAYVLVLFYLGLGAFDSTHPLHLSGAMSRTELLQGEWWRSITALTLHSGLPHLFANIVFLLFVGTAVIRELGRGLGIGLIFAGGIGGNYLAALTAAPDQRSVGASTACFAALGIISTIQAGHLYRRHYTWSPVWRQAWIPIAAGIALLGLTGTSPGSDIAAHLFGFFAGGILALPATYWIKAIRNISIAMQWTVASITAALLPLAWLLAYFHRNT
ncbi:MAG: rhomboid family intramembrane serine protease, partial [Kiritimatiellia bacterium]